MRRLVSLILILALLIVSTFATGCARTADGRKAQAQGTGLGVATGYAIGCVFGRELGGGLGALVGGGIGMAFGSATAKRKAKYAQAEQWLDQEILIAQQRKAQAQAYNKILQSKIVGLEKRLRLADKAALASLTTETQHLIKEINQFNSQQQRIASELNKVMVDEQARSASNFNSFKKETDEFTGEAAERVRLLNGLELMKAKIGH
jgi:hypothetical protein